MFSLSHKIYTIVMQFIKGLKLNQKRFITLFSQVFQIRNARGQMMPFYPEPFQQEFLKDSMLCDKNYKNRIVIKGRGIGLTSLVAGELVLTAQSMKNVKIPITSISARTANVLLDWCISLCDSSIPINLYENDKKIDFNFKIERDTSINSVCKLKNGSTIIPISGGSPESIRSLRSPMLVLDEFAFADYQKEVLTAGERCLSEGGQITIISTPRTSDILSDEFWRIYMHANELGYKKYEFPIFPKGSVNLNKPLLEQNLTPIAPWIDINQLEHDRKRDSIMFSRENLCSPADESVAFLPWSLIQKCCILPKFSEILKDNPIYCGIDVGREQDLTAIEAFQAVDGKFYHVLEKIMKGIDIPTQVREIELLDEKYDFHTINIDSTGIGLGLTEYARKEIGGKVHKVIFTRESKTKMATSLRNNMQDEKVFMIRDNNFMDILHSVPYDTLNAERKADGHADQFWGCALALMKPSSKVIDAGKMLDGYI